MCANFGVTHNIFYKSCPAFKLQSDIAVLRFKLGLTLREARLGFSLTLPIPNCPSLRSPPIFSGCLCYSPSISSITCSLFLQVKFLFQFKSSHSNLNRHFLDAYPSSSLYLSHPSFFLPIILTTANWMLTWPPYVTTVSFSGSWRSSWYFTTLPCSTYLIPPILLLLLLQHPSLPVFPEIQILSISSNHLTPLTLFFSANLTSFGPFLPFSLPYYTMTL